MKYLKIDPNIWGRPMNEIEIALRAAKLYGQLQTEIAALMMKKPNAKTIEQLVSMIAAEMEIVFRSGVALAAVTAAMMIDSKGKL